MKKLVLFAAALCVLTLQGFSQVKSFGELCNKYKNYEDVESIKVNRFGCFMLSLFVDDNEGVADKFMKKSTGFRLLTCEGNTGKELSKDVAGFIKASRLEEVMSVQEKENEVRIYIEDKEKEIRQVFISVIDKDKEMVFIQVEGKFPLSMIKELTVK